MWKVLPKDYVVVERKTFNPSIARIRQLIVLQFFVAFAIEDLGMPANAEPPTIHPPAGTAKPAASTPTSSKSAVPAITAPPAIPTAPPISPAKPSPSATASPLPPPPGHHFTYFAEGFLKDVGGWV